jgi:pyruvate dehydrogenase E1 component alpha subunit
VGDIQRTYYRSKEEEEQWQTERDPLKLLADWLLTQQYVNRQTLDQLEQRVLAEVEAGVQFALNASYPDPEEVNQHVYA